jgi:tetratricopeptide (TPR) repeat protein
MKEDLPFEIKKLYERWEKDKSSKIFAALANALRKMGLYDEALKVLNEGILRNPDYAEGYIVLGRINIEKGNINEGIETLKKAIEFDPYNVVAVRLLAECFENIGDLKSSLEYYKKLKNLDPFFENIDKKIEEIEKKLEIPEKKIEEISVFEEKIIEKEEEKILEEMPLPPELEEMVIEKEEKGIIFEEFEKEEVPPFLTEEKVSILDELEKEEAIYEEVKEEKIEIPEIEKAKIFEEKGFFEKALEIYKGILEKEPHNEEIKNKIREIEDRLKIKEEKKEEFKEEIFEEITFPQIPEEAIKVFEEIEEIPSVEEIFEEKEIETEKKIEYEEIPSVEEIAEEKEIKYSPHPFKVEEEKIEEKKEYIPFYEFKGDEIEELLKKMEEEKKKEEEKRKEIKEEIEKEEKIKDEEGFRTFLDWIEKLKK